MKRHISSLAAAVALTLVAGGLPVQAETFDAYATPDAFGCTYSFSASAIKWCVSSAGNLQKLESPAGQEHIQVGDWLDGFVLCVANNPTYYDTGSRFSANWGAPAVIAGPTSSSVTIRRFTTDGKFMVDHKWSRDNTERDLTLQMTVQNVSATAIASVKLLRIVDVDANNSTSANGFDKSERGTWIRNKDAVGVAGLTLTGAPVTAVTSYATAATAPPTCSPVSLAAPGTGDSAAWVGYDFGSLGAGAKKIVKFSYQVQ